ncbi:hypothetical protein [Vulgatibacter sp.]|uniref:hypothetical protein n=1 Tax=Vulgatibacter sp. TaxID=1971226 RepID=UPI0035621935
MNLATDHGLGRTTAALLGSLPAALATSVAMVQLLPFGLELRFMLGFFAFFVLWPAAICVLFLARSGLRAWGLAILLTAAAAGLAALCSGAT